MGIVIEEMTSEKIAEMLAEHKRLNPELPIADHIKAALDRYAYQRLPLGDFLTAVVENNLMEAMGRADSYNRATIYQICSYIYNELPSTCHGSPEKVRAHLASGAGF